MKRIESVCVHPVFKNEVICVQPVLRYEGVRLHPCSRMRPQCVTV